MSDGCPLQPEGGGVYSLEWTSQAGSARKGYLFQAGVRVIEKGTVGDQNKQYRTRTKDTQYLTYS